MWTCTSPLTQCEPGILGKTSAAAAEPSESIFSGRYLVTVCSLETVFEAFHHLDFRVSRRESDFGIAQGVKVVRLETVAFGAHEIVIRVHPGIVGGIGPAIFPHDKDPRRCGMPSLILHRNT